jgi:hypothetical protein
MRGKRGRVSKKMVRREEKGKAKAVHWKGRGRNEGLDGC